MRLRFFRPDDEVETARHLQAQKAISEFWGKLRELCPAGLVPLPDCVSAELAKISRGCGLPALEAASENAARGVELMFFCRDGGRGSAYAEWLVGRAPELPGVHLAVGRPPWPLDRALSEVNCKFALDLQTARFRVGVGRGHLLEIVIASELFVSTQDERALAAAEALVCGLMGDEAFDTWVGDISVLPVARPRGLGGLVVLDNAAPPLPLDAKSFVDALEAAGRGVLAGLAEAPFHRFCEHAEWLMFEVNGLRPEGSSDARVPLPDLINCATMLPEMTKTFLVGERFSSGRFSRFDETFVYLQFPHTGTRSLELRDALEETLTRRMVPGAVGCIVGVGLGAEYLYLSLAVVDLDAAIGQVRRCFAEAGVPNAWLRFCDDRLADEWVWLGCAKACAPPDTTGALQSDA